MAHVNVSKYDLNVRKPLPMIEKRLSFDVVSYSTVSNRMSHLSLARVSAHYLKPIAVLFETFKSSTKKMYTFTTAEINTHSGCFNPSMTIPIMIFFYKIDMCLSITTDVIKNKRTSSTQDPHTYCLKHLAHSVNYWCTPWILLPVIFRDWEQLTVCA